MPRRALARFAAVFGCACLAACDGAAVATHFAAGAVADTPLVVRPIFVGNTDATVSLYHAETQTGVLRAHGFMPSTRGALAFAPHPSQSLLYAVNDSAVQGFALGADGALTLQETASLGATARDLAIDPQGRFAFAATANGIETFNLPDSGALSRVAGSPFAAPLDAARIAVDREARFLFAADRNAAFVRACPLLAAGALGACDASAVPAAAVDLAPHPAADFLYTASASGLRGYAIEGATGRLTGITGSPFSSVDTRALAVSGAGFLYAASDSADSITVWRVADSGALALQQTLTQPSGFAPLRLALSPDGSLLWVLDIGRHELVSLQVASDSGRITEASRMRVRLGARSLAVSPRTATLAAGFAYVAHFSFNAVSALAIDAATGGLAFSSRQVVGSNPIALAVDPLRRNLLVVNNQCGAALSFASVVVARGTLTRFILSDSEGSAATGPQTSALAGNCPVAVAPGGSSRFAYVANFAGASLSVFEADPLRNAVVDVQTLATNGQPRALAVDPTGQWLYVASETGVLALFRLDPLTGLAVRLAEFSALAAPVDLYSLAIDPSGRYLYASARPALALAGSVLAYRIDADSGFLTAIAGMPFTAGMAPRAIAIDPGGRALYVTNEGENSVSMFRITADTGALTALGMIAAGTAPVAAAIDATGRSLYVANYFSSFLSLYRIDPVTGALLAAGTQGTDVSAIAVTTRATVTP